MRDGEPYSQSGPWNALCGHGGGVLAPHAARRPPVTVRTPGIAGRCS